MPPLDAMSPRLPGGNASTSLPCAVLVDESAKLREHSIPPLAVARCSDEDPAYPSPVYRDASMMASSNELRSITP